MHIYTHDWKMCTESKVGTKENSGSKACRLSLNCEENKVIFAIYQDILPKLANPRATILPNSKGPTSHSTIHLYFRKVEE